MLRQEDKDKGGLDRTEFKWDPIASFYGYGNENLGFTNSGKYLDQSSNSRKKLLTMERVNEGRIFDQRKLTMVSKRISFIFPPILKITIRCMKIVTIH
jgi:hypothetical protein